MEATEITFHTIANNSKHLRLGRTTLGHSEVPVIKEAIKETVPCNVIVRVHEPTWHQLGNLPGPLNCKLSML